MIAGLTNDVEESRNLNILFVLRLILNVVIGAVATTCLSIMCCNCQQAKCCIDNKFYEKRWRIFKVYTVSRMVETGILPPLDVTTLFLAENKIEKLSWLVWMFLTLQSLFRVYCTYIAHGYSTHLERGDTLKAEYCSRKLEKMR